MKKIALLSNINITPIVRLLVKSYDVYEPEGYNNELETLMNERSSLYDFAPEAVFLLEDMMELVRHDLSVDRVSLRVEEWFSVFEASLNEQWIYFVSDAWLYGEELLLAGVRRQKNGLEGIWGQYLRECMARHPNVFLFPYHTIIAELGEADAFSRKLWYLGKFSFSSAAKRRLGNEIRHQIDMYERTPKKVLVLDLDNTLWGGLAGEADRSPILLSEDGVGLVYKNVQRMLKQMQTMGTILCIASKNNETDAMAVICEHPHMVLREADFVAKRISWNDKATDIREMAEELHIGLDSIVFVDDSERERELVRRVLPEVVVPEFPTVVDEIPGFFAAVYRDYFEQLCVTDEDVVKTGHYVANARRRQLEREAITFEDYLRELRITAMRVDAVGYFDRLLQLVNKTNQFNLTTRRYTVPQLRKRLDGTAQVYAFRVVDRFGDNGIVAVVIVDCDGDAPVIEEFAMSCRVMGRNIEDGLLDYVENDLLKSGYRSLRASYIQTAKNRPVERLYDRLGYRLVDEGSGDRHYVINLMERPERHYHMAFTKEGSRT